MGFYRRGRRRVGYGGASGKEGIDLLSNVTQGAGTASTVEIYNREFHDDEKKKLASLKNNRSKEYQQRLDDAACALIHCSLQLSDANPEKAKYVEQEKRGATYYNEQRILEETGLFKYKMPWQLVADLAISRPNDAIYQYAKPAADKVLGAVVDTGFMYVDSISRFQKNLGDTLYAM